VKAIPEQHLNLLHFLLVRPGRSHIGAGFHLKQNHNQSLGRRAGIELLFLLPGRLPLNGGGENADDFSRAE
jgi:hypothetical protein